MTRKQPTNDNKSYSSIIKLLIEIIDLKGENLLYKQILN
jgi:hypothetical protein